MNTTADIARPGQAPGNTEIVARLWAEAFNAGNLDTLAELVHTDFTNFARITDGPRFLAGLIRSTGPSGTTSRCTTSSSAAGPRDCGAGQLS